MYSVDVINTYNESSLHKSLKKLAIAEYDGRAEQEVDSYICDVVTEDGRIIEIQTRNLGNIMGKLLNLLKNASVCLVYPLAAISYIEYYDKDGNLLSRRKSPKKRTIYHIFDELMGLWPALLHKNFSLEVIETIIVKKRLRTKQPVQSANKRRRTLRDWTVQDTALEQIGSRRKFFTAQDYIDLLPAALPEEFTLPDVKNSMPSIGRQGGKMLWTLEKMQILECCGKKGRAKLYKLKHKISGGF